MLRPPPHRLPNAYRTSDPSLRVPASTSSLVTLPELSVQNPVGSSANRLSLHSTTCSLSILSSCFGLPPSICSPSSYPIRFAKGGECKSTLSSSEALDTCQVKPLGPDNAPAARQTLLQRVPLVQRHPCHIFTVTPVLKHVVLAYDFISSSLPSLVAYKNVELLKSPLQPPRSSLVS